MTEQKAALRQTTWQIFAIPLGLGLVTLVGLVVALAGDGLWDAFSWTALGIPLMTLVVLISRGVAARRAEER
jgi:hypothetical protein